MTFKQSLSLILQGKRPLKDVWYYIQGNIRYKLFYTKFSFLIRKHIREQIEYRIEHMNPQCYQQGSCVICGCETTHLQMCNKAWDKPCYPQMMNKKQWGKYKSNKQISFEKDQSVVWIKCRKTGRPLLYIWKSKIQSYVQSN